MEKVLRYDLWNWEKLGARSCFSENSRMAPPSISVEHVAVLVVAHRAASATAQREDDFPSHAASQISTASQWHIWQTEGRYGLIPPETSLTVMWGFSYILSFVHLCLSVRLIAPIGTLLHHRDNSVTDGDFELPAPPIKN